MKIKVLDQKRGFSLVEVVLALGIMSFCLMALMALLPLGLNTIKNASEETAGINIVSNVVADLRSTPAASQTSPTYQIALPAPTATGNQPQVLYLDQAGGVLASGSSPDARYKVTITLSTPSLQNTITGNARLSWPARAVKSPATVEVFFALNRN
jgi:uncharacterized protein (TIGR02598 family)